MPTGDFQYPGGPPVVSGNQITVERFVKSPTQVYKVLQDLTKERFIADFIYAGGDAQGGAVLYDETTENDLYAEGGANGGDPSEIAPGDEFPIVGDSDNDPKVAKVAKRGAAFPLTYEAVRRDQRDVLGRGLLKLRNSSVKKHNALAVATLTSNATINASRSTTATGGGWDQAGADVFADLYGATTAVEQADLGYVIDTALINPQEQLKLLKRKDIRDALPRESVDNPVLNRQLAGLVGIRNWIVSNRVPAGTVLLLSRQIAGSVRDEVPFYSRTINQEERERYLIMAGRVSTTIVTDPLAVYKLTSC